LILDKYTYAIAGAGLSGLALAKAMRTHGMTDSLVMIDPRTEYKRDHIWCFWNNVRFDISLPFDKIWYKWKVKYNKRTTVCETRRYPYSCIFSENYYAHALGELLRSNAECHFLRQPLKSALTDESGVAIETENVSTRALYLFDSRPPNLLSEGLKQHFFGLHIKVLQDLFDPTCVTLMDFTSLKPSRTGFHFFYVLPFSNAFSGRK
jgi:hypothetical protein